jgi:hypothetical protein
MQQAIPVYTADGELCDWITEQRVVRLERLDLIQVVRHKKGHVARCILRRRPGDPAPLRLGWYLGTRYSFREHLDGGYRVWALKRSPIRPLENLDNATNAKGL